MICPNCRANFDGGCCPNCGYSPFRTFNRIAAVAVLVLLVLPSGLVGACSIVIVLDGLNASAIDATAAFTVLGVGGLAAAVFGSAVYGVVRLWRG